MAGEKVAEEKVAGAKVKLARAFAQRCAAFLALAALTLQLVLSFAHIHRHDLAFSRFDQLSVASVKHARSHPQAARQLPSRLADDEEHCTICFSSFLLASSSIPDAPLHPALRGFGDIDRSAKPVFTIPFQPRRAAFLSRAPPAA